MKGKMVFGVLVAVGLALVASASSEIEGLLPHAVVLWKAAVIRPLGEPWLGMTVLGVEDFNGDGLPDIICAHGGEIMVFVGDGTGGFADETVGFYELKVVNGSVTIEKDFFTLMGALGDLDGDGDADLAAVILDLRGEEPIPILVLFRKTGNILENVSFQMLPFQPDILWIRDINRDSVADLVLVRRARVGTSVYALFGGKPFSVEDLTEVGQGTGQPFFIGDVDGDDVIDVGLYCEHGVQFLLDDGTGYFPKYISFSPSKGIVHYGAVGDLDGDGDVDLVVATSEGLVVARQENGDFVESVFYELGDVIRVWLGDFTADGKLDALAEIYNWGHSILPGDGKGAFFVVGNDYLLPPACFPYVIPYDFNLDGLEDLLVVGGSESYVFMNGGEPRGESSIPIKGRWPLAVGDIDEDGDVDVVIEGQSGVDVLWNSGQGGLKRLELFKLNQPIMAAAVLPGRIYILTQKYVFRNFSDGKTVQELIAFSPAGQELQRFTLGEGVIPLLGSGDLDGDGRDDLVILRKQEILVLWGGEELVRYPWERGVLSLFVVGRFPESGVAMVSTADYAEIYFVSFVEREPVVRGPVLELSAVPVSIAKGDLDGDGVEDVVTVALSLNVEEREEEVQLETGALLGLVLSCVGPLVQEIPAFPQGDSPWPFTGVAVGDFTGDGLDDVIFSVVTGKGAFLLPNSGGGTFGEAVCIPMSIGPLFAADLDQNGRVDLISTTLGLKPFLWILWNGGGR